MKAVVNWWRAIGERLRWYDRRVQLLLRGRPQRPCSHAVEQFLEVTRCSEYCVRKGTKESFRVVRTP